MSYAASHQANSLDIEPAMTIDEVIHIPTTILMINHHHGLWDTTGLILDSRSQTHDYTQMTQSKAMSLTLSKVNLLPEFHFCPE